MKILYFSFAGPLQSWGEDSRWDSRATSLRPTKSGIMGFLGCCLGYSRGDERLRQLNQAITIAIRMDKPGQILTDYQTVQGSGGVFLSAEGKPRSGGGTIVTPKQYLQDSRFTVFLQAEDELLQEISNAMQHPRWTPYLGRKNCVPSIPVIPRWIESQTLEEAVTACGDENLSYRGRTVAVEMDAQYSDRINPEERTYTRNDNLIHPERNEYASRFVKSFSFNVGGDEL